MRPPLRAWIAAAMLSAACRDASDGPPAQLTWARDVQPILQAKCSGCHRPGQGAPFNLLTFEDARSRAHTIAEVTTAREMPPWLPEPNVPPFIGERRLSAQEIDVLSRWAATGAARGDEVAESASGVTGEWQGGTPDLVLRPAKAFQLQSQQPGAGADVFRNLVIRTSLPADRFVRAVEFKPGGASIHHAVLHLDRTAGSRELDGRDGQPGFDGMGAPGSEEPDGHFVGWAPGRGPINSAVGRLWRLARGMDLVLELHLIPGPQAQEVMPSIALFFGDAPVLDAPIMMKMGDVPIDIPPGADNYEITDRFVLPADVQLLSVYPHAHYLGKEMRVTASLPDGVTKTLLHIKRWSFHWQQDYRFMSPVTLPKGTTIDMRFTYDNSDANGENPHHPPVRVTSGPRSTDEMGNLLLQLVPASSEDRPRLILAALQHAVEVSPRSARAHNELGGALLQARQTGEALRHFREAVSISPRDAHLHFNLAKALGATGAGGLAVEELRRAIALKPDLAEAYNELGVLLFAAGRVNEALVHLRRAVELAPDSSIAHSDLGGALAQSGRREEALGHIRRALVLDPANQAAQENLRMLAGRR